MSDAAGSSAAGGGASDLQGGLRMASESLDALQRTATKASPCCPGSQHRRLIRDVVDAATLANGRLQDVSGRLTAHMLHMHGELSTTHVHDHVQGQIGAAPQ